MDDIVLVEELNRTENLEKKHLENGWRGIL